MTKALEFLQKNRTIETRAEKFASVASRDIQQEIIVAKEKAIEKKEDELFDLTNFVLDTNHNKGMQQMTSDQVTARFVKIINLEVEIEMSKLELTLFIKAYNKYFGDALPE